MSIGIDFASIIVVTKIDHELVKGHVRASQDSLARTWTKMF
jgi:hypothetical protein